MIKTCVSKSLFMRLAASAEEADIRGDSETAQEYTDLVEDLVENKAVLDDKEFVNEKMPDLQKQVSHLVRKAFMAIFSNYGVFPDPREEKELVKAITGEIFEMTDSYYNPDHFEKTPGQQENSGEVSLDGDDIDFAIPEESGGHHAVVTLDDDGKEDDGEEGEIVIEGDDEPKSGKGSNQFIDDEKEDNDEETNAVKNRLGK